MGVKTAEVPLCRSLRTHVCQGPTCPAMGHGTHIRTPGNGTPATPSSPVSSRQRQLPAEQERSAHALAQSVCNPDLSPPLRTLHERPGTRQSPPRARRRRIRAQSVLTRMLACGADRGSLPCQPGNGSCRQRPPRPSAGEQTSVIRGTTRTRDEAPGTGKLRG